MNADELLQISAGTLNDHEGIETGDGNPERDDRACITVSFVANRHIAKQKFPHD